MTQNTKQAAWLTATASLALFAFGAGAPVSAAPVACSPQQPTVTSTTADVTLSVNGTAYSAFSCKYFTPANSGETVETSAFNTAFSTSLVYLGRNNQGGVSSIAPNTPIDGIRLSSLTADTSTNPDSWGFTFVEDSTAPNIYNLPLQVDLGVILKGGSEGVYGYFFKDILLPADPSTGAGTFTMTLLNNGGNVAGYSHLTLVGGNPRTPTITPGTPVPEPMSLALLGSGLLGLGIARRARRRTA